MSERKEYKEALVTEAKRILSKLNGEEPSSPNYVAMVKVFSTIDAIIVGIEYDERDRVQAYLRDENKCSQPVSITTTYVNEEAKAFPSSATISESVGEPDQLVVEESVPWVDEEPEKEEKLTKEKVRALLKEAADAGVMVQPIMAKFIPEGKKQTFSSVKASDYPALVKELEDAK